MLTLKKELKINKRNVNLDRMMYDNDVRTMLDKQKESDLLQKGLIDRQKEDKYMLGQIYQNQIDQAKKIKDNEFKMERELEKAQIQRLQGIDPEAYNKMKKQAYQNELKADLDQRKNIRQHDQYMREQSMRESKKLMNDYAQKEMMNEQSYRNKFAKFDQGMQRRMQDYNSFVMKPHLEKQTKLDMIESKNMQEYDRKRAENEIGREARRKAQMLSTSTEQK